MKEKLFLPHLKPALTLEKFLFSTWELQVSLIPENVGNFRFSTGCREFDITEIAITEFDITDTAITESDITRKGKML